MRVDCVSAPGCRWALADRDGGGKGGGTRRLCCVKTRRRWRTGWGFVVHIMPFANTMRVLCVWWCVELCEGLGGLSGRQAGARTEACLAANKWQVAESKEWYMGGCSLFVLMLSHAEMMQRQRVMEALHAAQLDTKKKTQVAATRPRASRAPPFLCSPCSRARPSLFSPCSCVSAPLARACPCSLAPTRLYLLCVPRLLRGLLALQGLLTPTIPRTQSV